jgi:hypothetical protein
MRGKTYATLCSGSVERHGKRAEAQGGHGRSRGRLSPRWGTAEGELSQCERSICAVTLLAEVLQMNKQADPSMQEPLRRSAGREARPGAQ